MAANTSGAKATWLAHRNPIVAKLFERGPKRGDEYSVDDLLAELRNVSRAELVPALKELEGAGFGRFSAGRRGWPSRFAWDETPPLSAAAASGAALTKSRVSKRGSSLLTHDLHVRPGVVAKLMLPADLTRAEAERLAQFLLAIPFQ
jgi:hypothetical protein